MAEPYLHPESEEFLELAKVGVPYNELSILEARQKSDDTGVTHGGDPGFTGDEKEYLVPQLHHAIPMTVYTPETLKDNKTILMYFHGGGWIVGSRTSHSAACKTLAMKCGCIVGNVEYRMGPEAKIPACYDDAKAVMEWVLKNKEALGGHEGSKVGVAGDSAGGTISAVVCFEVPGIDFQILVYPMTDFRRSFESYRLFGEGYLLTTTLMNWFQKEALEREEDIHNSRWSVLSRTDSEMSRLPPALFIVAGVDPLRDDSVEYEKKLKSLGVDTEMLILDGAVHSFFHVPGHFKNLCGQAYTKIQEFVSRF